MLLISVSDYFPGYIIVFDGMRWLLILHRSDKPLGDGCGGERHVDESACGCREGAVEDFEGADGNQSYWG
jgi:hypothetical protein